eukprot:jgi/Mesen1/5989/ME000304S05013
MIWMQAIEEQVLSVAKVVEDQLDEKLHKLQNLDEDDLEQLRERRLEQYKRQAKQAQEWQSLGHGEYQEIPAEKEFFAVVKASKRVVCHFYRNSVPCKVVDKHLAILALQHLETKFVKLNAEKSPFLAEKLKIFMLPTLALVINAKVEDYVVGLDDVGGVDDFETEALERRLAKAGVINQVGEGTRASGSSAQTRRSIRRGGNPDDSDSE